MIIFLLQFALTCPIGGIYQIHWFYECVATIVVKFLRTTLVKKRLFWIKSSVESKA